MLWQNSSCDFILEKKCFNDIYGKHVHIPVALGKFVVCCRRSRRQDLDVDVESTDNNNTDKDNRD